MDLSGCIIEPPRDRYHEALAAVFNGSRERAQRFLAMGRTDSPHLLLAVSSSVGRFEHAAVLCAYPGRTAMLMVTSPRRDRDTPAVEALVREAIRRGPELNALLVQALVEPLRDSASRSLHAGGMRVIGTLAYLERPRENRPARNPESALPAGVRIRSWDADERELLERLLEQTYVDSLDCPGLSALRPTRDILEGHMRTGVLDPRRWLILEVDGDPAGVALTSEIPSSDCVEIVYFGLAPRARGRGLGAALLDRALECVRGERVTLACDESNAPAMKLYRSRGFALRLRRTAMVAPTALCKSTALPTTYPLRVDSRASC